MQTVDHHHIADRVLGKRQPPCVHPHVDPRAARKHIGRHGLRIERFEIPAARTEFDHRTLRRQRGDDGGVPPAIQRPQVPLALPSVALRLQLVEVVGKRFLRHIILAARAACGELAQQSRDDTFAQALRAVERLLSCRRKAATPARRLRHHSGSAGSADCNREYKKDSVATKRSRTNPVGDSTASGGQINTCDPARANADTLKITNGVAGSGRST